MYPELRWSENTERNSSLKGSPPSSRRNNHSRRAEIGRMVDNIEHVLVPAIECAFFHPIAQFAPCHAPVGSSSQRLSWQFEITVYILLQDIGASACQTGIPAGRTLGRSKPDNQYLPDIGTVVGISICLNISTVLPSVTSLFR